MNTLRTVLLLLLATAGGAASAQDGPVTAGPAANSLFLSALALRHGFDPERGLAGDVHGAFGMGFRFNERISAELTGGRTPTSTGLVEADVDTLRLDALWHFDSSAGWQPWVSGGFADQETKAGGAKQREGMVVAGIGLFRRLGGPFLLRAEWRLGYSLDEEAWDHMAGIGLTAAFGGSLPPR